MKTDKPIKQLLQLVPVRFGQVAGVQEPLLYPGGTGAIVMQNDLPPGDVVEAQAQENQRHQLEQRESNHSGSMQFWRSRNKSI